MSNQFYEYLSSKLIINFQNELNVAGSKYYIEFDEENQVLGFYHALAKIAQNNGIYEEFVFKHEKGDEFKTFSLKFNNLNVVVTESVSVNIDYLVTLRNQVTEQKGVWKDTILLVICHTAIDSIYNGMRDLQKEGMPFSIKTISENLLDEINESNLSKADKVITEFYLDKQEDELSQTTLWDYEEILSIINRGFINKKELKKLDLFPDENLADNNKAVMKKRLEKNRSIFNEIKTISQFDDKKEWLVKKYKPALVNRLNDDDWETVEYKDIENGKLEPEDGLGYIESGYKVTREGLPFWEKPFKNNLSGVRKRHIIVFNDSKCDKISLSFSFDKFLRNEYLSSKSKNIAYTKGKKLFIEFNVSPGETVFKRVSYNHKNETKSSYIFNIVVVNVDTNILKSIQHRYVIGIKNKCISIINDEDSEEIIFGDSAEIDSIVVEDGDTIELPLNQSIAISEKSQITEKGTLTFDLNCFNTLIPFEIKEESKKPVPVKSLKIWNNKRTNKESFKRIDSKVFQSVDSFYIEESFKNFLDLEQRIIEDYIFYGKLKVDGSIEKIGLDLSPELEKAYQDILNYYKQLNNCPSLVYLDDNLMELYTIFIDLFNKEISEIEEGDILSNNPQKKNLLYLGRIDTKNKIMFSSLSPLNIVYRIETVKQLGMEKLKNNILERLVPNNLVPFIYSENDELYRPVHQTDAHEWIIYENSENVAIGTTNAFIANVVSEKLNQFIKHYGYLFANGSKSPLKINLINLNDDMEVVKGIFKFIRDRLPDREKNKEIIPIEVSIYNDLDKSSFDELFKLSTKEELKGIFGIDVKSKELDEFEIIRIVQDNIMYYNCDLDDESFDYAHISFFKENHFVQANENMNKIETGLSLNGILSSVTSINEDYDYRTGFGTKNAYSEDLILKTAINLNELAENSKNKGKNTYSKYKTITTATEFKEETIEKLYECSHWVTFIEPNFGLEYFKNAKDLIIIHYSDQYSSSSKYDTITVTNKSKQYEKVIQDFLEEKSVSVDREQIHEVIRIFNCINGEWLLRILSNPDQFNREKLSIVSAIKYILAIFDHKDLIWIPISMEEILRISGNVKLDQNKGIFANRFKKEKGVHSDDLLFIGLEKVDNNIKVHFYPIEVKVGLNNSNTIKKGITQLANTYKLLADQLNQKDKDNYFRNKFFRNFFMQILLSNEQKIVVNGIWNEKQFERIEEFKSILLNDKYEVSCDLEKIMGKGSLISFKKDATFLTISPDIENDIQHIELPENYAYEGLTKSVNDLVNAVQNHQTDFPVEKLLSRFEDLNNISDEECVFDKEVSVSIENVESDVKNDFDENIEEYTLIETDVSDEEENSNVKDSNDEPIDFKEIKPHINHSASITTPIDEIRALIGTDEDSNSKIYWEFGNPDLGNRHLLIQGKSGQGKTYFIQRMLKEMSINGIPSIIIDYTDGFKKSKLETVFKEALGDRLVQYVVLKHKFPLNPFKKHLIELDENDFIEEDNIAVASRFKDVLGSVYDFGPQQLNTIYEAISKGLNKYKDEMDLLKLKNELLNSDSSNASSVLSKLNELLDKNPFDSDKAFNWSVLDERNGDVIIVQLTGISKEIQKIIAEMILWDLWNYKAQKGSEDNPFVVVLDEAHNLDFSKSAPCHKILAEGRKFGWSGWFATQSIKSQMSNDAIGTMDNAEEKIFFHPTDQSVSDIAKTLSKSNSYKAEWENKLSALGKGQCVVYGPILSNANKFIPSYTAIVNVDPIVNDFISDDDEDDDDPSELKSNDSSSLTFEDTGSEENEFGTDKEIVRGRKSKFGKYISSNGSYYIIKKVLDGKLHHFGYFKTHEEAIKYRDFLIDHNWDTKYIKKPSNRYIKKIKNGYSIIKKFNGEPLFFGTFDTIEEAKARRDILEKNNWVDEVNFEEEKYDEFIYTKNGKFFVKNFIGEVLETFAIFDSFEDAIAFRNKAILYNWDTNRLSDVPGFILNESVKYIPFSTRLGKTASSKGFAISREYLYDLIPHHLFEDSVDVLINNKFKGTAKIKFYIRVFFNADSSLMDYFEGITNKVVESNDLDIDTFKFHGIFCLDNEKNLRMNSITKFNYSRIVNSSVNKGAITIKRKDSYDLFSKFSYEDKCNLIFDGIKYNGYLNLILRAYSFDNHLKNILMNLNEGDEVNIEFTFNK